MRGLNKIRLISTLAVSLQIAMASVASSSPWLGPDGRPLPLASEQEVLDFLGTAKVVKRKELSSGINRSLKVTLERDGVRANAIFRMVDKKRKRTRIHGKDYRNFHDSYVYECAAYELSRLLGMDNVPPCTSRRLGRMRGTIQLWVEDAITEKDRINSGERPRCIRYWVEARQIMGVFDALIYNFDRHHGNMLYDASGKIWLIDHTRSFYVSSKVVKIDEVRRCERGLWERLRSLDKDEVKKRLGPYVGFLQIKTLWDRRDTLVGHIESLIERRGEEIVLFDRFS